MRNDLVRFDAGGPGREAAPPSHPQGCIRPRGLLRSTRKMSHPGLFHRAALALALAFGWCRGLRAEPAITEFLAANSTILADNDGVFSDWIELHNPDVSPVSLAGWYLTDSAATKTKWQFPDVTLPPGGYLIVWASNENRRDPTKPLHTNFVLNASGDYLALVKPDGVTVATEFAPSYPAQLDDVSYGITQPSTPGEVPRLGYFRTPTPGARNGGAASLLLIERVAFSRASGPFTGSFTLTLSGAGAGQRIRYTIDPPRAAGVAATDPGPTATEYTGPFVIAASSVVRAAVYSADNVSRGEPSSAHYVRLGTTGTARLDTFASQLPLMVIDTHGSGPLVKDNLEHPGWFYTWNRPATGNTTLTGTPSAASYLTTNVRGASSADFPKKSYTVRLQDTSGHDNPLPLYGLPSFDRWSLIGPWTWDLTYIHNAFIYALSNRIGRWAPRTQLVELFFNANGGDLDMSDYAGVYILTDALRVDPKRIDIAEIEPSDVGAKKITGGYVLKYDVPDPDEFSFQLTRNFPDAPSAIVVNQPKGADLPQAQRDYIRGYVQALDDALTSDLNGGWRQRTHLDYLDRSSWVDSHILNVLAMNADAFVRSTYFTKDRGGRIVAGPAWDYDRAMDGGDPRTDHPDVWSGAADATDFWNYGWWGMLAQDPEFVQEWIDRWQTLRRNEFATANLTALVDSLAAQVGPAAAARDAARWPDDKSGFPNGWQGEIDNMKSWLTQRVGWIDLQFIAPPTLVTTTGVMTITPAAGSQLAYTTDGTDPRAFGGGLANSARLSSTPITVPDTTELQARSYRLEFNANTIPSSAWSSAVGGSKSLPLNPRPRLANLSSRGFVGTGESVLITGVVVNDTAGKQYLARAVGPALTGFGVSGALNQPVLRILDANGRELASNSGWENGPDASDIPDITKAVGAFPFAKGSSDAALLARLPYGQYTLQISSANNATGVGLAEIYEVDAAIGRTINLSTRGVVRAGEALLIGGVVVRGPGPKRLLVRAIGPTLASFGVTTALDDPLLDVFSGATRVATNDDWGTRIGNAATAAEVAAASRTVGAFPLPDNSRDAALLVTLPEGAYTAQITGKAAEGVILLEIYEVQ